MHVKIPGDKDFAPASPPTVRTEQRKSLCTKDRPVLTEHCHFDAVIPSDTKQNGGWSSAISRFKFWFLNLTGRIWISRCMYWGAATYRSHFLPKHPGILLLRRHSLWHTNSKHIARYTDSSTSAFVYQRSPIINSGQIWNMKSCKERHPQYPQSTIWMWLEWFVSHSLLFTAF